MCRQQSVGKLDAFRGRIEVVPGATDDPEVIRRAVAGCAGVVVVLVPLGMKHYASGTAQAVLDDAPAGARLVFSYGWWPPRDGKHIYSWEVQAQVNIVGRLARLARVVDLDDQAEATRRVFASDTRWTFVWGSDLEEDPARACLFGAGHVGDLILHSNLTRRIDFELFMVEALTDDELIHQAPAIVGRPPPSALVHAAARPTAAA